MPSITTEIHAGQPVAIHPPQKVLACRLKPDFASVRNTLNSLSNWLQDNVSDHHQMDRIELTLAEALNNVVDHGGLKPQQYITLFARQERTSIRVVIRDQGKAYPEFAPPKPTIQNATDLPEGGFGWMLIHSLSDSVSYERLEPGNVLTNFRVMPS